MKPSELAKRRSSHVCVFGDPKTGKSTLVAKLLLSGFHLTWISMDNGHEVIFKLGIPMEVLDTQLSVVVIPDTKENPIAIGTVRKILTGSPQEICDLHGAVGCSTCRQNKRSFTRICLSEFGSKDILVLDHGGQISDSCMNVITIKKNDEYKYEWDDYNAQGSVLAGLMMNIQQSKANIIMITHVTESEMEDGKKKLLPMMGTRNFSRNVGKYFDHLIYCEMSSGSHKFGSSTTYKASVMTGSRTDVSIEKDKEASLVPFFDGTILPPEEQGTSAVKKVLDIKVPEKDEFVVEEVVPAPAPAPVQTTSRTALLAQLTGKK